MAKRLLDHDRLMRQTKAEILTEMEALAKENERVKRLQAQAARPLDRERLLRQTKAEILTEVEAVLEEREKETGRRLRAQAASVQGLLRGRTYEEEMGAVHRRLVETEQRLEAALEELRMLKGTQVTLMPVEPAQ